jgi:5'-3' exonuclease
MSLTILVDGNSIGYASHHATILSAGGQQTQAVLGFIKTMRQLRMSHPQASMLVLWDGKAHFRYDLLNTYKGDRNKSEKQQIEREAYKSQVPFIQSALTALGIAQVVCYTLEADDLAGYFTLRATAKSDGKVLLISGDQDWAQLVRKNVTWRDLRDDSRIITIGNFFQKTGYNTPYAFLEGKCLQGDSSDCIGGVGGIGEATAPLFLAEHGSVRNFWEKCDSGEYTPRTKAERSLWKGRSPFTKEEWMSQFIYVDDEALSTEDNEKARKRALKKHLDEYVGQGRTLFGRNFRLMQLLKPQPIDKSKLVVTKGSFDAEAFADLCGELAFMSILKGLDNFLLPFKR